MAVDFNESFSLLTGNDPFPWQTALFERFINGNIPKSCNLPTGLGKTSVVAIWLIALACRPEKIPRRLVYVVNRRTVVDQTTDEVEKMRRNLDAAGLREPLKQLCAFDDDCPLGICTLRGQFADNREWSADPARPAVIVGTVDMIGSRLLFSGYGIGFKSKPLHAGFLGQDSLVVHDEAHLEPAFQKLLVAIDKEQRRCKEFRTFQVMELSATSREGNESVPFELTDEEKSPPDAIPEIATKPVHVVWRRLTAKKRISLHENVDEKRIAEEITELALKQFKDSNRAILIFLRRVDDVEKVIDKLRKAKQNVQQLTGTLRGLERDNMADPREVTGCPIFARFLRPPKPDAGEKDQWKIELETGTVYLVCTSAGEVGVNISADHLLCDLSTFDSMAQRFGRVNRFGDRDDTEIHVIYPNEFDAEDELDQRRGKTLDLLRALDGTGSPMALGELDSATRRDAFAVPPTIVHTSDILFDSWALTTIRDKVPGRPPVEPYLHGVSEWEPPETHVAWRQEVWHLRPTFQSEEERRQLEPQERKRLANLAVNLLDDYPLKPHELLRDRSDRVFKHLAIAAERHPHYPAWLLDNDGGVEPTTLSELADNEKKERINERTILLPPVAGGLLIDQGKSRGMLSGSSGYESEHATRYDVADECCDVSGPHRLRKWDDDKTPDGMRLIRTVILQSQDDDDTDGRKWYWYERLSTGDGDGSRSNTKPVAWQVHTDDVTTNAEQLVKILPFSEELKSALILAARFHDLGKKRVLWQRDIGNPTPTTWLAKSGGKMRAREMTKYRHEFGSLLDIEREDEFLAMKEKPELQELVLHLIAVHHGFGRPHFPPESAFDPESNGVVVDEIAAAVPGRFARMQRRFGRWGLAYVESLLRAADWAASAKPSSFVGDQQ